MKLPAHHEKALVKCLRILFARLSSLVAVVAISLILVLMERVAIWAVLLVEAVAFASVEVSAGSLSS